MQEDLEKIRRLIGAIDKEQLRYVDCFIEKYISLFMPEGSAWWGFDIW